MNTVDVYATQMSLITGGPAYEKNYIAAPLYGTIGDRDLTYNNPLQQRERESPLSFFGDDLSSQLLQQSEEVDHLILYHAEKVRTELLDPRRRIVRQALTEVGEHVSKRLREKDEEIERIGKLNCALEEQIRGLIADNEIWREFAQCNEAMAVLLRNNLEEVIAVQVLCKGEDSESCCGSDNCDEDRQRWDMAGGLSRRVCKNCGEGESSVLLLPCRHMCVCRACEPVVNACPVCKCSKDGSVHVNLF